MRTLVLALVCSGLVAGSAAAAPITQGALSANIDNTNGAISNVSFGGTEFYRQGTFVSDFGYQVGTNTGTFQRNTAGGSLGTGPVTVTAMNATTVVVTGASNGVAFTRTYSAVPGLDVLRTAVTLTNTTSGTITNFRAFEAFDPDQGIPSTFSTLNDVFPLVGIPVSQASVGSGLTVVAGGLGGITGFLNNLGIFSGGDLNSFFGGPLDPNGASGDIGFAFGFQQTLAPGQTVGYTFDQAFGTTPQNAQNAFVSAQQVPEPATLAAFGAMAAVGFGYTRRRKAVAA